jgi:hypothetical protein
MVREGSPPRDIRLDQVRYRPQQPPEPAWYLLLTWTVLDASAGNGYSSVLQLYEDAGATMPLGRPVKAGSADGPGVWSPVRADVDLDPAKQYWIAVIDDRPGQNRPVSNTVTVLWQPARLVSLSCEEGLLDLGWSAPPGPCNDYEVTLTSPAGEWLLTRRLTSVGYPSEEAGVRACRLDLRKTPLPMLARRLPFSLRPIYVEQTGVSYGPRADAQAYVGQPVVLSARFTAGSPADGMTYAAEVQFPTDTTPQQQYQVTVTADGRPYSGPVLSGATGPGPTRLVSVTVPPSPQEGSTRVPAGAAFATLIARADTLAVGPAASIGLITTTRQLTGADYSDGELSVTLDQTARDAALVTIQDGQAEAARAVVTGRQATIALAAEPGHSYTARAAALAGTVLGPPGPEVPLLTAAPALVSADYDGAVVRAAWSAPTGPAPDGYRLRAHVGGGIAAVETAGIAYADLPLRDPAGPVCVDVTALSGAATGPACQPVPLILQAPRISAATDPVSAITEVSWGQVPGATAYRVQLYRDGFPDGDPVEVPGTAWPLPRPLSGGSDVAVAVTAVAASTVTGGADSAAAAGGHAGAPVAVSGPAAGPVRLTSAQVVAGPVSYDGEDATVAWETVDDASGYTVSICYGETVLRQVQAGATAADATVQGLPVKPETGDYRAVVQVQAGGITGPPSPALPLLAPALYLSTDQATRRWPHVYLTVNPHPDTAKTDVTALLPELGDPGPLRGLPIGNGPFVLSDSGNGAFPYRLTIPKDSDAWTFGTEPFRDSLADDYVAFLIEVEGAGAAPPGITALQGAVSRLLPQTFPETLYYGAGVHTRLRTVDLRPGMVMRVEIADYINMGSGAEKYLTGYAGGAPLDIEVRSYWDDQERWLLGFDSFVAELVAAGVIDVDGPPRDPSGVNRQGGMAAAGDLFFSGMRQPFYRLFPPDRLPQPSASGTTLTTSNFVLAGAGTFQALKDTVNYPRSGSPVVTFRGRAIITPCLRITVNGQEQVVELGTTVGNILDQLGVRPPVSPLARIAGLRLRRPLGPVMLPDAQGIVGDTMAVGDGLAVRFDWQYPAVYGGGFDALSLPVLPGDELEFGR